MLVQWQLMVSTAAASCSHFSTSLTAAPRYIYLLDHEHETPHFLRETGTGHEHVQMMLAGRQWRGRS